MSATLEPLIRWAGGKRRLLPQLVRYMPDAWSSYYEPFAGGAALFFHLGSTFNTLGRVVLSDVNEPLMAFYRAIADVHAVPCVVDGTSQLLKRHNPDQYADRREQFNLGASNGAWHASLFWYLTKTCFNGVWRENRRGLMNTPCGNATWRGPLPTFGDVYPHHALLARAWLRTTDYATATRGARTDDFVYLDPPYDAAPPRKGQGKAFTSYSAGGFGEREQRALAAHVHQLVKQGAQVMISQSDTKRVRELYAPYRIIGLKAPRAVASNGDRRAAREVIIVAGYEPPKRPRAR